MHSPGRRVRPLVRALTAAFVGPAAVLAAAAVVVGSASPAGAHATLIGTAPAADGEIDALPELVELRFDEPVETVEGAVQVYAPDGDRVDVGTVDTADDGATLRAALDPAVDTQGTYTVAWRVTSEDSHTLSGSFVFHNGTRTGGVAVAADEGSDTVTDVVGGLGRWLGLTGTLAAVGAAVVTWLRPRRSETGGTIGDGPGGTDGLGHPVGDAGTDGRIAATPAEGHAPASPAGGSTATIAPASGSTVAIASRPEAPTTAAAPATRADRASLRLSTLTAGGAVVGAVGALVALVAAIAESAGRGLGDAVSLVPDLAGDTRTGQLALLRVALGLAAGAAALVPALWRRSPLPALVPAAAALVTWSLAGHAWTAPQRWVAVASDVAHLGAVAVWVGGVLALLVALPLLAPGERGGLAHRFSGLALVTAVVVAASGTVSGWQQVGRLDALTSTSYGRLLLAKVAGFAVLVALGWMNRSRLVPLAERSTAPLRRSLRAEVLVAAVVLAVTAALIHQPPARSAPTSEPFETTATADTGATMSATVDPATAGTNDIHLYFYAGAGSEPLAVDAVQVTAATTDVPARRLQVTPVSTNHVTVAGASLPSAGTWTVEVTAVQAGEPLVFTFEVPIA